MLLPGQYPQTHEAFRAPLAHAPRKRDLHGGVSTDVTQ
jgi:hypothetical protein